MFAALQYCVDGIGNKLLPCHPFDPAFAVIKNEPHFAFSCQIGWQTLVAYELRDIDMTLYEGIVLALVLSHNGALTNDHLHEANQNIQTLCDICCTKLINDYEDGVAFELLLTALDTLQILGHQQYPCRRFIVNLLTDVLKSTNRSSMVYWAIQYCYRRAAGWINDSYDVPEYIGKLADAVIMVWPLGFSVSHHRQRNELTITSAQSMQ